MFETKDEVLRDAETKMKKAVSVNQEELASIRSGRATPTLLNRVTVDYYGTQVPLNTIANLSVPEPRLLVIAPYDASQIGAIEKAILASTSASRRTTTGPSSACPSRSSPRIAARS